MSYRQLECLLRYKRGILFDASQLREGETVFLKSIAFDPMEQEGGIGGMGGVVMGGEARIATGKSSTF